MEGKKSFVLYADLLSTLEALPDDKAGQLFKIILRYVNDQDPEIDDLLLKIAFEPIKLQLKRDLCKWVEIQHKRREAGALGGRPSKAKKANAFSEKQTKAKKAVNVTVNVNDNVNDITKEQFESARKIYPGTKRSLETEYENFRKVKNYRDIAPLLEASVRKQKAVRAEMGAAGKFVPEWKHFKTWINNAGWEEELNYQRATFIPL